MVTRKETVTSAGVIVLTAIFMVAAIGFIGWSITKSAEHGRMRRAIKAAHQLMDDPVAGEFPEASGCGGIYDPNSQGFLNSSWNQAKRISARTEVEKMVIHYNTLVHADLDFIIREREECIPKGFAVMPIKHSACDRVVIHDNHLMVMGDRVDPDGPPDKGVIIQYHPQVKVLAICHGTDWIELGPDDNFRILMRTGIEEEHLFQAPLQSVRQIDFAEARNRIERYLAQL